LSGRHRSLHARVNGGRIGPLATSSRKSRQVRKEATVAVRSGAGMWRVRFAALFRRLKNLIHAFFSPTTSGTGPDVVFENQSLT